MSYLPSKRTITLGVVLLCCVGLVWWLNKNPLNQNQDPENPFSGASFSSDLAWDPTEVIGEKLRNNQDLERLEESKMPKDYIQSDLVVGSDRPEEVRAYGIALAKALEIFSEPRPNENSVFIGALDSGDLSAITSLRSSVAAFETVTKDLEKMSVPPTAVKNHIALINTTKDAAYLLTQMLRVESQPVIALEASRIYLDTNADFYIAINEINRYFGDKKLEFGEGEKINVYVNLE